MFAHIARATILLTAIAAPSAAQFSMVPGSGCPSLTSLIKYAGTPQLNQQISAKSACSTVTATPFLLVGLPIPLLALNPPTTCGVATCQLAVLPVVVVPAQGGSAPITFVIPNDPTLIGQSITFQGACVEPTCIGLTAGVMLTVM